MWETGECGLSQDGGGVHHFYSASEERPIEDNILHGKLYFHMPEALNVAGAEVDTGPDFEPHVIEDRELITGQNPRSDHPIAKALIAALERRSTA